MNPPVPKSGNTQSQLDAPPRPELKSIRWCLILFLFSFAADFGLPAVALEGESTSNGVLPFALLAVTLTSGGAALLIGFRHLFVRPGAYLVLSCFGLLAFTAVTGIFKGDEAPQIVRSLVTPLLLGLGISVTHVAACAGMRATEAIRYFLIATGFSLLFQWGFALRTDGLPAALQSFELGSPLTGFLIAWSVCALILRRTITRRSLSFAGLAIAVIALGIARGITLPILIPAVGAGVCLILGMIWRLFPRDHYGKRFTPIGILIVLGAIQAAINGSPAIAFSGLAADAEVGSGFFGFLIFLGIVLLTMGLNLRAAWRNSETIMGRWARDASLMFLPFVALLCLLGVSLIRSPFEQPFAAVLTGMLMALPQFFFNRAFYLRHRENEAAISPQLILSEEDLSDTWKGAFPSNA